MHQHATRVTWSLKKIPHISGNQQNLKQNPENQAAIKTILGKQFSSQLVPHITELYNNAASSSKFPIDYLNALIVTIPKPGKETNTPKNFRPISLLNLVLKIYAKTIATRLLDIIPTLIHRDQTGFTKGRQAPDATRRMINLRPPERLLCSYLWMQRRRSTGSTGSTLKRSSRNLDLKTTSLEPSWQCTPLLRPKYSQKVCSQNHSLLQTVRVKTVRCPHLSLIY